MKNIFSRIFDNFLVYKVKEVGLSASKCLFLSSDNRILTMTESNLVRRHLEKMKTGEITVHNWRDHFKDQGHESEIQMAEEIFDTSVDTKNLTLDHLDANTASWVFMALEWMHDEKENES